MDEITQWLMDLAESFDRLVLKVVDKFKDILDSILKRALK